MSVFVFTLYINIIGINQTMVCNNQFQAILVYLNPPNGVLQSKVKNTGDRASPCFKPFLIGNMSDKFLPTRTLLHVSVRHTFLLALPVSWGFQTQ